jgi:hypothetical protein
MPEKGDVSEQWRTLQNEELHDLCRSPSIVRVVSGTWLGWGYKKCIHNFGGGKPVRRFHFEDQEETWRITLRMILGG